MTVSSSPNSDLASPHPKKSTTDLFGDPLTDSHPLWLNPTKFSDPDFDPESYISDLRTFVPFDTLRSELNSHLASLKHELVDLINRDYADYVSLSTKLVDVDAAVVRMRAPLLEIKEKILGFRGAVDGALGSLIGRLKQREQASVAREVLELFLDTFHVVSKVEKLIKELPSVPADWSSGNVGSKGDDRLSNGVSSQHDGTNLRETQSMLLERIASEMNRLKFYIAHSQDMPFIKNMEKRIQSASSLLDTSLGHCFVDGLEHRDANAIYNCLRAYAAIENTSSAEDIFRAKVVAPFVHKVVGGSTGDELEQDYERIKRYVEDECKFLLDISSTENSGLHVFSFLANSILKEVLSAITKGKPGAFSPGRPTEFLKNYKSSLNFLAYLEGYCSSRSAVAKFRAEGVYIEFMKQWNIGVYFSLRFQEIAGALDSALVTPLLVAFSDQEHSGSLVLKQSTSLMDCVRSCWKDDVLVISCSDKFLRLFLQLLSRYSSWLLSGLNARKAGSATPGHGSEWAISAGPDDFLYIIHDLRWLVEEVSGDYLDHVLEVLKSCPVEVLNLVKQSILQGGNSLNDLQPLVVNSIVETLVEKSVEDLRQLKGITATFRMTNKSLPTRHSPYVSSILRPLKAFLEGERAAKYLTSDLKTELCKSAAYEITHRYNELAADLVSVNNILQACLFRVLRNMLEARRTESSLQRIRLGAQRRGGASSDVSDNNVSDTEKLCMQLFLDIQEYGRNLASLDVNAADIPAYRSLWQCVAPQERQNTISF